MNKKVMLFAKIALSVSVFLSITLSTVSAIIISEIRFLHVLSVFLFAFLPTIALVKIFYDEYTEKLVSSEARFQKEISAAFINDTRDKKRLLYASYLYTSKKYNRSLSILEKLKGKCTSTYEYRAVDLFCALNYTALSKYREAIAVYESATILGYANAAFYSNLGHLYAKLGDSARAHQSYDIAICNEPNNIVALHNKAHLYYKEGKHKEARALLERVNEINPSFAPSASLLASVYAKMGDLSALSALKLSTTASLSATATLDLTLLNK